MNTQLKYKQKELKTWLKKLGLSQNIFAIRIFYHMNESDNEEEIRLFTERFKKAINRNTTDVKLIDSYLEVLFEQSEFLKLGLIRPQFYYEDEFTDEFNIKMKDISKRISENINDRLNIDLINK